LKTTIIYQYLPWHCDFDDINSLWLHTFCV